VSAVGEWGGNLERCRGCRHYWPHDLSEPGETDGRIEGCCSPRQPGAIGYANYNAANWLKCGPWRRWYEPIPREVLAARRSGKGEA
jgi:hypothetical protein